MASFYDQISANKRNSYVLMLAVLALTFAAIYSFSYLLIGGGAIGLGISVALSVLYIAISYSYADKLVLSISGAREAKKGEFPYLVNVVEGLSIAAGVPMPKV